MIRKVSGCLCKDTGFCYRAEASNPRPMGHSVCVACKSLLKYWMTQPQLASLWERMVKKKKKKKKKKKNPPAVRSLCQEDPLETEMAAHSSILAWKIPRTEEPGMLQSMGLQRVGHD